MSKEFRPWKIDEAQLLPPSVQDYVPADHLSRLIVVLVQGGAWPFGGYRQLPQHARTAAV